MIVRRAMLPVALFWAGPGLATQVAGPSLPLPSAEPPLQLGQGNFALPVIDYRAPDGTWKRSHGIIIGHDVAPNATVGVGFFKIKPKYQDTTVPAPSEGKSRKISLGLSLRF